MCTAFAEWYWHGKNIRAEEKPVSVPLRPPHISHGPIRDRFNLHGDRPATKSQSHSTALHYIQYPVRTVTEHSASIQGGKGCVLHESEEHKYDVQRVKCRVLEVIMASPIVSTSLRRVLKAHWKNFTHHKVTFHHTHDYRRRHHLHYHQQQQEQKQLHDFRTITTVEYSATLNTLEFSVTSNSASKVIERVNDLYPSMTGSYKWNNMR